jgi:hypothetical protein
MTLFGSKYAERPQCVELLTAEVLLHPGANSLPTPW